jgi:hypothetical protein
MLNSLESVIRPNIIGKLFPNWQKTNGYSFTKTRGIKYSY